MSTKDRIECITSFAGHLSANAVNAVQGGFVCRANDSSTMLTIKKYAGAAFVVLAFLLLPPQSVSAAPADGDKLTNVAALKYQGSSGALDARSQVTFRDPSGTAPQRPTDILLECTVEADCSGGLIIENVPGQILGNLVVVDPDTTSGHDLSVTEDIRFEIVNGQLKLEEGEFRDFETEASIDITVRAIDEDGLAFERIISIVVRDVNEAPFNLQSSNNFVVPGSAERRIGLLTASDVDADETLIFSIIGDDRFIVLDGDILALADGIVLPPNTTIPITIMVTDKGGLTARLVLGITTEPPAPLPVGAAPTILFMAPDSTGNEVEVPEATCSPSPGFIPSGGATSLRVNLGSGDVSGSRSLSPVDAYAVGEPIIVSVVDAQANIHPFELDRIEVRLTIEATGDSEFLTLVETDTDTGVFFGFVFTTSQQSTTDDCILTVASRTQVDAVYTNRNGLQTVTTLAQISPVGILFNDLTGDPINGVILVLINEDTGEPALVSGDGPIFAAYPSTVITGETITDASGAVYENGPGEYRFPAISEGRYRLVIFNDEGWNFSAKVDEVIQALGGQTTLTADSDGRFTLTDASRGDVFNVSQGAIPRIDIPVKRLPPPAAVEPTPSKIEFLQYSSNPNFGTPVNVGQTTCVAGINRQVSELRDVSVPVPGIVNLSPATVYKAGQPIFVRVTDLDQNFDPIVREKIIIQLKVPASGDREFLSLTETEPDSGQFVGYIQSTQDEMNVGNCTLGVVKDEVIETIYSDIFDQTDFSESLVLVDPFGRVFSTKDGRLIDGVNVTLINTATGQPAQVFGDGPGFASFPSTIITGGDTIDDGGLTYDFPAGEYRFPFVEPGFYQLRFDNMPPNLIFPSTASDDSIQSLTGAPFAVVIGSRGEEFEVPIGPALNVDIPLDEPLAEMFISKTASRELVAIGDFVQYRLTIENRFGTVVANTQVQDTLPKGFRYQGGSLRVEGDKVPDPAIGEDGRTMFINLPPVSGTDIEVTYVTEITPGAPIGEARNSAIVIGDLIASSNTAFASVLVRDDLFSEKAFLVGRVAVNQCDLDAVEDDAVPKDAVAGESLDVKLQGVPGVRIYLEDGSYVVTDKNGSWHMEGIEPGTHIIQMDTDSLEERYEASPCNDNSRFSGSPYSQFVDVQGGTLWRSDFEIQEKDAPQSEIEVEQTLKVDGEGIWVEIKAINRGDVLVTDANIIYSKPRGWEIVNGTEVLDGAPTGNKPSIVGAIYSIGNLSETKTLRFVIRPKDAQVSQSIIQGENKLSVLRPGFRARSAELSDDDKRVLKQLVQLWRDQDWEQVTIVGHSDNVPNNVIVSADGAGGPENYWVVGSYRDAATAQTLTRKLEASQGISIRQQDVFVAGILHHRLLVSEISLNEAVSAQLNSMGIKPWLMTLYQSDAVEFADNKALSEARAAAVAEFISDKISVKNLVVVGAGDQYPIASNETQAGRASNRRVEFLMKPVETIVTKNSVNASVLNGESLARLSFVSAGTPRGRTGTSKIPLNRLVGGFDKLSSKTKGVAVGSWDLVTNLSGPEVTLRDPNVQGFINVTDGDRMGLAVKAVKIDLDSRLKPKMTLDGEVITNERIGFSMADDATGKTLYSYIGVNFGEAGKHVLTLEGSDSFGNIRFTETLNVVRVGELHSIKLISASENIADGTTPVSVKLELLDKSGEPLGIRYRIKLSESQLRRSIDDLSLTDLTKLSDSNFIDVDSSGYMRFDPVSVSGTYPFTLSYNDFEKEFEVFVEAEKRKWIMVGLAEGSVAYKTISGNIASAEQAGLEEDISTDGRVAFYAKGQVKGEYVLTMAYDSTKEKKNALEQSIDPNSFYTLYGDKTSTQYDSSSQEKLFLKLEKDQFYALFGDFSTGLSGGELTAYSRSLTGLKSEFRNETFDVVVFASETDQAFIKDEIRGDGTSGLYRLSTPGLITNSEKISIETRDRFRSQDILETKELRRFIDYNIDYDAGTLFFKEPIFSQDPSFNPLFIVVDYEVDSDGADELNYGGRVAYSPNENLEVGVTLIREGVERRESDLLGIDVEYQLDDNTVIRAEIAATKSAVDGVEFDGTAYVLEANRRTGNLDTQAYVREQQGAFGLGQQNDSEIGTRKIGATAKYQVAEGIEVAGEAYRDSNLQTGVDQDVATTSIQVRGDKYSVNTGIRTAMTSGSEEADRVSNQLIVGGSYRVLDGRLVMSANADTPIAGKGETGNFPKRLRVGLDYKLTENITLKAEQEFTWGDDADTQSTRIGMSTSLWKGGEFVTSVQQNDEENSQRLAAVAGLKQRFELNENWSFDFGVDRSQTIKQVSKAPPDLQVTTVFSSPNNDDFTSVTFGSKFRKDAWDWSTRVEYRDADSEDKVNLVSDVIHNLDEGQQLLAKLDVKLTDSDDSETTNAGIRLGYSYRPDDSRWTLFNRLDLQHNQSQNAGFDTTSQKIINNLNANYQLSGDTQIALQYGLKYVVDNFDNDQYRGFTDLYGMEVRHDLSSKWDVGFQGSLYNSWSADVSDYSYGVSVGYNMARNVWVSLGYNFDGFQDEDFSASEYTSKGLFLKYRVKFDQNTANSILGLMGNQ